MHKAVHVTAAAFALLTGSVRAASAVDVICAYAPSQSKAVQAFVATTGGAAAATSLVTSSTGLVAVAHSSSAIIFTGSSGYVAGTLGGAGAAPLIMTVAAVVGGAAVTFELVCAPKNHAASVARVKELARDYAVRSKEFGTYALEVSGEKVSPMATAVSVRVKQVAGDVFAYAHRARD